MPQFFVDIPFRVGADVEIRGAEARHITQVLRLGEGDWIVLSDGAGRSFRATIRSAAAGSVVARIEEEIARGPSPLPPALALATIKGDRFEWAVQKAVEIGCRHIIPFRSQRTIPRSAEGLDRRRRDRWRRIALEAAKQSGLPFRPEVGAVEDFGQLTGRAKAFRSAILLYEGERQRSLRDIVGKDIRRHPAAAEEPADLLIVGPEGGFADAEVARAVACGAETASLGRQILRVETAAIVALAIWQYELGNMDAVDT